MVTTTESGSLRRPDRGRRRRPTYRTGFRFTPDGRHVACLAVEGYGEGYLERWTLTLRGPRRALRVPLTGDSGDSAPSQHVPVAGGRVLLVGGPAGSAYLRLVGPGGVLADRPGPDLRVTAAPPAAGLALALRHTPSGTEVHLIEAEPELRWSPVAGSREPLRGPGLVAGGQIVFHVWADGAAAPVLVDPAAGTVTRVPLPPQVRGAVPVHAAGDTVLVGVSIGGQHRLARLSLRWPGRFDPLATLDRLDGVVQPLALDPTGAEVALRLRHGARSRLLRHQPATGDITEIVAPPGTAAPPAAWPATGLWLPYATTTAPAALWWLPPDGGELRPAPGGRGAGRSPGWVATFPGPAGPVEAVGYGDWRRAERVVLALHGGPAEHWSLTYNPGLGALDAAGLAVVAPNPRGSTGYGRGYEQAIKGAWGGPDLADVVAVGAHLVRERGAGRPRPGLYGVSYGAFLGLLAVAEAPELWSGCVAVAPFLSGPRLHADATPPVRALLDRLDGAAVVPGRAAPQDLLQLASRMRGRVLVVHGERDQTIPVRHSRDLVAALADQPGVSVTYREFPGRGHQPVPETLESADFVEVVRFLGGG